MIMDMSYKIAHLWSAAPATYSIGCLRWPTGSKQSRFQTAIWGGLWGGRLGRDTLLLAIILGIELLRNKIHQITQTTLERKGEYRIDQASAFKAIKQTLQHFKYVYPCYIGSEPFTAESRNLECHVPLMFLYLAVAVIIYYLFDAAQKLLIQCNNGLI